jgi:hypothetical protein
VQYRPCAGVMHARKGGSGWHHRLVSPRPLISSHSFHVAPMLMTSTVLAQTTVVRQNCELLKAQTSAGSERQLADGCVPLRAAEPDLMVKLPKVLAYSSQLITASIPAAANPPPPRGPQIAGCYEAWARAARANTSESSGAIVVVLCAVARIL